MADPRPPTPDPPLDDGGAKAAAVKDMFARIAPRYDLLNRLLSARRDVAWRGKALALLEGRPHTVADLACGTFDLGLQAIAVGKAVRVHGIDFCQPMLVAGAGKRRGHPISASVGDALRLPFADGSIDAVIVAYGWRNFSDAPAALTEMRRVLAPHGQILILEFFRPSWWWPRLFYASFGRWIFPALGGLLARDAAAYRYLHDSVQRFLTAEEAASLCASCGFEQIRRVSCFGGISHAIAGRLGDR